MTEEDETIAKAETKIWYCTMLLRRETDEEVVAGEKP